MPAYISKETGNGRQGYLEAVAADYEKEQAALKAAHEALGLKFTVWGVECPVWFGTGGNVICIAANGEGFLSPSSDEEKADCLEKGMKTAFFQTKDWSQSSVENAVLEWATEIAQLGGCWD